MSLDTVKPAPGYLEHLPVEYQDLVKHGQYGKKKKVSDMGKFKELIEEHPMCAGCAMTLFIRLVFLALPVHTNPHQVPHVAFPATSVTTQKIKRNPPLVSLALLVFTPMPLQHLLVSDARLELTTAKLVVKQVQHVKFVNQVHIQI